VAAVETPLMKQYNQIKAKYPDAILLFRVGDFYETFGEDAIKAAKVLGITLTKRANGAASHIELAGFPHHALDTYLPKMVKAGYRVAICDQLEDPKKTKTIVKRGVTELVTPGVTANDHILDTQKNNYLASVYFEKKEKIGIAFIDISTGDFFVSAGSLAYIEKLLQSFRPSEIIFSKTQAKWFEENFGNKYYTFQLDDWIYAESYTTEILLHHFETNSLKGYGIAQYDELTIAAGAILYYLKHTEHNRIKHISKIQRLEGEHYVWMDRFTIRNLELIQGSNEFSKTLVEVLDDTVSPMGSRMMRKWLVLPLKDIKAIEARQDAVATFINQPADMEALLIHIKAIGDIERLISKVSLGKVNPREMVQLKRSLGHLPFIVEGLKKMPSDKLRHSAELINPCSLLFQKLERELSNDAPVLIAKGGTFNKGIDAQLDDLRDITSKGKDYILKIQQEEIERTGISSLKVGFNNVFGYYLEVTNTHKHKVPANWIRKQTLTNAERYITEELKVYEQKVLTAEEKILAIEEDLFNQLLIFISDYIQPIQYNAHVIAEIDCLASFASVSIKQHYVKPVMNDSLVIDIKEGRHPVIEQLMPTGEMYVPNDVYLSSDEKQIMMITGPNMSGKSAVLRQTALIVLMAQIGCFVPATSCTLGITDKIFTRVGASDNLSSGESTFMVEMNETAGIINNISERSLILLDEIGRGTSTYDGISIAWSIAEYLHFCEQRPKTLFATHYHELNELAEKYARIKNYHITTHEHNHKIIFLRKLAEGGTEHSFGIHVARLAGMPKSIIERANTILVELEDQGIERKDTKERMKNMGKMENYQLSIFDTQHPELKKIEEELNRLNIESLTPIEALMKINEWKHKLAP
jgi:DNA mismatch repair protein MutS